MHRWLDGWMHRWMDGWLHSWMDGRDRFYNQREAKPRTDETTHRVFAGLKLSEMVCMLICIIVIVIVICAYTRLP